MKIAYFSEKLRKNRVSWFLTEFTEFSDNDTEITEWFGSRNEKNSGFVIGYDNETKPKPKSKFQKTLTLNPYTIIMNLTFIWQWLFKTRLLNVTMKEKNRIFLNQGVKFQENCFIRTNNYELRVCVIEIFNHKSEKCYVVTSLLVTIKMAYRKKLLYIT